MKMIKMLVMKRSVLNLAVATIFFMQMVSAATNQTVGGPNNGWNNRGTDYQTWSSSQRFLVGDNLIFQYGPNHDVTEVSQTDYNSCSSSNPLQPPFTGGETVISLSAPGSRYFICTTPGHCANGMKLQIDTVAATPPPSSPPPTSSSAAPPPTSSSASPPKSPTPAAPVRPAPPPSSSAAPPPTSSSASPPKSPPPAASVRPAQPPSAAAEVNVRAGLGAGFGLFLIMLLNL